MEQQEQLVLFDPEGHSPNHHHHHPHPHREIPRKKKMKTNPAVFRSSRTTSHIAAFVAGCAATAMVSSLLIRRTQIVGVPSSSSSTCQLSFGTYRGHEYHGPNQVGPPTCLVESKFLKVQQHRVRLPPVTSTTTTTSSSAAAAAAPAIIPDWLWIDYHDRINVLVEAPSTPSSTSLPSDRRFLVFEQTKYALEGRMSLAVVGGIIEPGEATTVAAQREVHEELHLTCREWEFLGRYRTDVNRGAGWTNTYLASQCSKQSDADPEMTAGTNNNQAVEVGAADTERQDVKILTLPQLREAAREGRFLEIQWSATVALAILHLDAQHPPNPAK